MTDLRKAAEMALKTLENERLKKDEHLLAVVEEALRQSLAQPEQEPMAWQDPQYKTLIEPHKAHPDWIPLYTAPPNLKAAVLAEREACLKEIAIELDEWNYGTNANIALNNVAANIRARRWND